MTEASTPSTPWVYTTKPPYRAVFTRCDTTILNRLRAGRASDHRLIGGAGSVTADELDRVTRAAVDRVNALNAQENSCRTSSTPTRPGDIAWSADVFDADGTLELTVWPGGEIG